MLTRKQTVTVTKRISLFTCETCRRQYADKGNCFVCKSQGKPYKLTYRGERFFESIKLVEKAKWVETNETP